MTPRARIPALFAAVLLAGVVTGCASGGGTAQTSPPTSTSTSTASPSAEATPGAEAAPGGIPPVMLGMSLDDAIAITGATPVEGCEWVATAEGDGYTLSIQRAEAAADDTPPVVLVSVSAPADATAVVGPRTTAGIGLGSTVDEALAAYPDAEQLAPEGMGDRRYLRVATGGDAQALFLTYSEGQPNIWAVTATTLDVPPYEACA